MRIEDARVGIGQCLEIKNKEQYGAARHMLRNPLMDYDGPFPIYFERANSVTQGSSVGIIHSPKNTWTGESLKILTLDE